MIHIGTRTTSDEELAISGNKAKETDGERNWRRELAHYQPLLRQALTLRTSLI